MEEPHSNSAASALKRRCLSISTSFKLAFRYVKATFVAQAKKLTAKNEKEVTEADMLASKMQVDAADDAENAMNQINKSH